MKTCAKCHTQNNDNANFCRHCGTLFPGIDGKSYKIDKLLVDKVNELQSRLSEKEETIISKKKEIDKLSKKVSSLDNQITSLSTQTTTLQSQLLSTKQSLSSSQAENKKLGGVIDGLKTDKKGMHIMYLLIIGLLFLLHFIPLGGNSDNQQDNNAELDTLRYHNTILAEEYEATLFSLRDICKDPNMFIASTSVRNHDGNYGETINSQNTTYLYPLINLFSAIEGSVVIYTKFITPDGLSTYDDSPNGYTFRDTVIVKKETINSIELSGYGDDNKGKWGKGNYRYEFYHDNNLIGAKEFSIE